ncbi:hypothetical protein HNQ60_000697 [Povalibacter uvarum]|uniref:Uncharacterized protein n=1 Tax=Povalibacter uvarum TaxID=732238 RepID=A0A841HFF9_9GAMM|nr:hypothetical protein [Povalibacter uvarum]MBB6091851.1 hypothetical protein [Povalibacter uvarum]
MDGRLTEIANALYEAREIIAISQGLSGKFDAAVSKRLQSVAGGPLSYLAENPATSSNAARNLAFELLIAERLAAGGQTPTFPSNADVGVAFGRRDVAIQCKRLWSPDVRAIERNFCNAQKDLKPALKSGANGIVAFDLSRHLNPRFSVLTVRTEGEIREGAVALLQEFLNENSRIWDLARPGIIGIMARASFMAQTLGRSRYTYCQQFVLTPAPRISQSERETLERLNETFAAATHSDGVRAAS